MVHLLLQGGAAPDEDSRCKRTPLMLAVRSGHVGTVDALLAANASPACRDVYGTTPIHEAAALGARGARIMALLLAADRRAAAAADAGGGGGIGKEGSGGGGRDDVTTKGPTAVRDAVGRTALAWAAYNGAVEACALLLAFGADPNVQDRTLARTPLHDACRRGHPACVALLLIAGASPDAVDRWSRRPLRLAAVGGHTAVMLLLLGFPVSRETGGCRDDENGHNGDDGIGCCGGDDSSGDHDGRVADCEGGLDGGDSGNVGGDRRIAAKAAALRCPAAAAEAITAVEVAAAAAAAAAAVTAAAAEAAASVGVAGENRVVCQSGCHRRNVANIDEVDERGCSALHAAAEAFRSEAVAVLAAAGASMELKNGNGLTPEECCTNGEDERAKRCHDLLRREALWRRRRLLVLLRASRHRRPPLLLPPTPMSKIDAAGADAGTVTAATVGAGKLAGTATSTAVTVAAARTRGLTAVLWLVLQSTDDIFLVIVTCL
ncbi:unnamed protein product [Phaeothamnion confervicola]